VDSCDGPITDSVVVTGEDDIDTSTVGTYNVTYSSTDTSLNNSTVVRVVNVVDTTPPVITLLGDLCMFLSCGEGYVEPGATSLDGCYGDLTSGLVITDSIEEDENSVYYVSYVSVDGSNNSTTEYRKVVRICNDFEDIVEEGEVQDESVRVGLSGYGYSKCRVIDGKLIIDGYSDFSNTCYVRFVPLNDSYAIPEYLDSEKEYSVLK
jgi:hypothetical protein